MKRPNPISRVTAAFQKRGRSPLYRWLWEHYDELPYEKYRVSWSELVSALTELKITGLNGKPLNEDMVRKTFARVRSDRPPKPTPTSTPQATPVRTPVRPASALPTPPAQSESDDDDTPDFPFVKERR